MDKFEIGEIVEVYNVSPGNRYYFLMGEHVEIITVLEAEVKDVNSIVFHYVVDHSGQRINANHFCLRRIPKRSDMDEVGRWEDCGWKPKELETV